MDVGDPAAACPYLQGGYWKDRDRLFTAVHGGRTWDNWYKLQLERFGLDVRKNCFPVRTGSATGWWPREVAHVLPWGFSSTSCIQP